MQNRTEQIARPGFPDNAVDLNSLAAAVAEVAAVEGETIKCFHGQGYPIAYPALFTGSAGAFLLTVFFPFAESGSNRDRVKHLIKDCVPANVFVNFIDAEFDPIDDPTDIAALQIWREPHDPMTLTGSGGLVSAMADKSGNGHDFVQATGAAQPATGVDSIYGMNALTFDSVDDYLAIANIPNSGADMTIFHLLRVIFTDGSKDGSARFNGGSSVKSPTDLANRDVVIAYRLDATAGTVEMFVNGRPKDTGTYNGNLNSVLDYKIGDNAMRSSILITYEAALTDLKMQQVNRYIFEQGDH